MSKHIQYLSRQMFDNMPTLKLNFILQLTLGLKKEKKKNSDQTSTNHILRTSTLVLVKVKFLFLDNWEKCKTQLLLYYLLSEIACRWKA